MPYLTAAVVIVGILCLLNLVLTLAVVRRLREHSARLDRGAAPADRLLPVGTRVGEVTATDTDGDAVTSDWLQQDTRLVVVMSTGCPACLDEVGPAVEYAARVPDGRDSVLAVVAGPTDTPGNHSAELLAALGPAARLATGLDAAALTRALNIDTFPSFYLLHHGRVVSASHTVRDLAALLPVPTAR